MKLDTSVLNQLKSFNDFAVQQGVNSKAVARLDGAQRNGGITSISKNTNDKVAALFRSQTNRTSNDSVRTLFRDTIAQLFGGMDKVPADVKKKMELYNYDCGKPLTARRIAKVSTAIINTLLSKDAEGITDMSGNKVSAESVKAMLEGKDIAPVNQQIKDDIYNFRFDNLPQDVQKAFDDMQGEINARCGEGTVKNRKDVVDFIGVSSLTTKLYQTATGLVRNLNGGDVTAAMRNLANSNGLFENYKMQERLNEIGKDVPGAVVNRALVNSMFETIPELQAAVKRCHTPEEYSATIDEFVPQMTERLKISTMVNICAEKAGDILTQEFEKMTGIPVESLNPPLAFKTFSRTEVDNLRRDINNGKVDVGNAEDVKQAFVKLAQDYVKVRMELANKVDDLKDIPDWARNHLRQTALVAPHPEEFRLEGAALARELDLAPLNTALSAKPFNLDTAVQKMRELIGKIVELGVATFGMDEWSSMGVDGQQPFASVLIKCALASSDPRLLATLHTRSREILDGVSATITNAEGHLQSINAAIYPAIQELGAAGAKARVLNLPVSNNNQNIASNIKNLDFGKLPQDIQKVIEDMKGEINERCGEGTVKTSNDVVIFIRSAFLYNTLIEDAAGLKRDLNGADVQKACRKILKDKSIIEHAMLLNHVKGLAQNFKGVVPNMSLAMHLTKSIPGLMDELKSCKNPADFQTKINQFRPQIEKRLHITATAQMCKNKSGEMLIEEYVKATGMDKDELESLVSKRTFSTLDADPLFNKIDKGEIKVESDADVEKAFRDLAKDYISKRQALAEEADSIQGIPFWARDHIRLAALTAKSDKEFNLNAATFANQIDLKPLRDVLCGGQFNINDAVREMRNLYKKLAEVGTAGVGGKRTWDHLGVDGQQPFVSIMFKCAVANNPELLKALNSHIDEIREPLENSITNKEGDLMSVNNTIVFSIKELHAYMVENAVPKPPSTPAPVPEINGRRLSGSPMPTITNQKEFEDFFFSLDTNTQYGSLFEDGKMPDALGNQRETFIYRGIVFRGDDRKISHPTMTTGFTSRNDLTKNEYKTEAMGLGVKGKDDKGKDIVAGPGATGWSGVSCAKTIGGAISYLDAGKTFYVIDTTKIPKDEKAWDMENTILKNKFKETDESNGEVNVSYIPRNAIIGWVNIPLGTQGRALGNTPDSADKLAKLKNIATAPLGSFAKLTFNPEYKA